MSADPLKKADVTKKKIVQGLVTCIIEKGYAQTKLVDVAEACDTSTPHIRYYFKSKEAILEYQYVRVVEHFETAIRNIEETRCGPWLRSLAELIFSQHPAARDNLLVLMEANIVMARSAEMRSMRRRYDRQVLVTIEAKLATLDLPNRAKPKTVASALFDLLSGQMVNAAIDPESDQQQAVSQFCFAAQALTGLKPGEFER